jgi:hypothetical protein
VWVKLCLAERDIAIYSLRASERLSWAELDGSGDSSGLAIPFFAGCLSWAPACVHTNIASIRLQNIVIALGIKPPSSIAIIGSYFAPPAAVT